MTQVVVEEPTEPRGMRAGGRAGSWVGVGRHKSLCPKELLVFLPV